jgi:NodT family efflux transporter outer membrane factor (OMF) lipoprotein
LPKSASLHNAQCKSRVRPLTAASILALLAGCAVGPNFKRPSAPEVSDYVPTPLATTTSTPNTAAGESQRFAGGADIAADWWTLFHSAPLNELIDRSLSSNHDLKAAQAALKVARENMLAQRGVYFPSVSANFDATRQKQSEQISPVLNANTFLYNLFTPQVSVSYTPDVFGLNRRTVESLAAQEQEARFQMIATYTTLTSNVVVAAIQVGATQMQIDATHELIDSADKTLKILRYQLDKGYANGLDVAAVEGQLALFAATLPPLIKQEAQLRDQLAVLAGRFPSQAPAVNFDLATLQLPQDLPVSLPSTLVSQRPDVLQAEANLHDASAKIGIASANRLPNIVLTANAGSSAAAMNQLFTSGTGFWGIGASITAPIFQGGQLLHQERAAKAAYEQAAEQYRSTVLTAFQNVADTLTALEQDADAVKATANAADSAKVTLDLTQRQLQKGYAGYLALLSAQQAYQQARIGLIQAQASRFADTAALFQALGGGWWHRTELAKQP